MSLARPAGSIHLQVPMLDLGHLLVSHRSHNFLMNKINNA